MIHEAYVSFETAKLLKEKGFDYDETHMFYSSFDSDRIFPITEIGLVKDEDVYYAPTHQMACAWLREVHNMHIDIDPSEGDWHPCVIELETWSSISDGNLKICDTYEDAVESAIKYCLETLI